MKIGFVGLGKLGLPVAVAMAAKGHPVVGFDVDPERMSKRPKPGREGGRDGSENFNDVLAWSTIGFGPLEAVADHAEIIFVAVQTPHAPEFEGITPLPPERADFDYSYLKAALGDLARIVSRETVVAVISTVLPGTCRRELLRECNEHMRLVYNPSFIAMGTTIVNFLNPELVLCGGDDEAAMRELRRFYKTITSAEFYPCSLESAELIKVAYNTFIGLKLAFANTLMELCHAIPDADVDDVTDAIKLSTHRVVSGAYLSGGMGDGGACHPRDNIAMSWLASEHGLSYDLFGALMKARECQAVWLAALMVRYAKPKNLPLTIVGCAYKPESDLEIGSHALLVADVLDELYDRHPLIYDPFVPGRCLVKLANRDAGWLSTSPPFVGLIGVKHSCFEAYSFPIGSVIIDPWRYLTDHPSIEVVRLGAAEQGVCGNPLFLQPPKDWKRSEVC